MKVRPHALSASSANFMRIPMCTVEAFGVEFRA